MNDEQIASEQRRRINDTLDQHSTILARLDANLSNLVVRQDEHNRTQKADSVRIDDLETFRTQVETKVSTLQWVGGVLAAGIASLGAHVTGVIGKH